MSNSVRERLETTSLVATSIVALIISLLDLLGLLDGNPFLKERIPIINLLVLSILSLNIPFKGRDTADRIEKRISEVLLLVENIERNLLTQPAQGIEIFSTTDEILERLAEVTVGSYSVSTLNLSPSRGKSPALDRYFSAVHGYMRATNSKLMSFRSLASLENSSKARWILERGMELLDTGRFSQSVFPFESGTKVPVGFHIVYKAKETPYVFFYPPVNPAGMMNGFLIKNEEVANTMLKYFDFMWISSPAIHAGGIIKKEGLDEVLKMDVNLEKDKCFKKMLQIHANQ